MSQITLLSKILVHLLLQRKILNTYQQSMTLIPILNGRSLQVSKVIYVLARHNFNTHISRPLLTGNRYKYKVNRRGDVIMDKSGKEIFDTETRRKGCVDPEFIDKHHLGHKIKPEDFVGLFLPFGKNQQGKKEIVSFELLTKWTNLKATLVGEVKGGRYYTDCVPFSVE